MIIFLTIGILFVLMMIIAFASGIYFNTGHFKKFYHDILGWHRPNGKYTFSGGTTKSVCRHCGKEIKLDKEGNWF